MNLKIEHNYKLLLFFVLATLIGVIAFSLLGNLASIVFLGLNPFSTGFDINNLTDATQVNYYRLVQPFHTLGIFLFPVIVVKYFFKREPVTNYTPKKITSSTVVASVLLIIMVKPLVTWFASVNYNLDFSVLGDIGNSLVETSKVMTQRIALITKSNNDVEFGINLLVIALIPAIAEEFFFRGFLQTYLYSSSKNYHLSVWLTALAFGLIHFNILAIIPLIFLGAILGYIYHFSENIWVSIFAHFINNATLLFFVYKYSYNPEKTGNETIATQPVLLSLTLTIALLVFLHTVWQHRKSY